MRAPSAAAALGGYDPAYGDLGEVHAPGKDAQVREYAPVRSAQPDVQRLKVGPVHLLISAALLHNEHRNPQRVYVMQLRRAQLAEALRNELKLHQNPSRPVICTGIVQRRARRSQDGAG